jgi:hypothetical protein
MCHLADRPGEPSPIAVATTAASVQPRALHCQWLGSPATTDDSGRPASPRRGCPSRASSTPPPAFVATTCDHLIGVNIPPLVTPGHDVVENTLVFNPHRASPGRVGCSAAAPCQVHAPWPSTLRCSVTSSPARFDVGGSMFAVETLNPRNPLGESRSSFAYFECFAIPAPADNY